MKHSKGKGKRDKAVINLAAELAIAGIGVVGEPSAEFAGKCLGVAEAILGYEGGEGGEGEEE